MLTNIDTFCLPDKVGSIIIIDNDSILNKLIHYYNDIYEPKYYIPCELHIVKFNKELFNQEFISLINYVSLNNIQIFYKILDPDKSVNNSKLNQIGKNIADKRFHHVCTCELFQTGYNPYEYLRNLFIDGFHLDLVHLNDSKFPIGHGKISYKEPGHGKIGPHIMEQCIQFCIMHNIPMIKIKI
jgi:hypothetical protein